MTQRIGMADDCYHRIVPTLGCQQNAVQQLFSRAVQRAGWRDMKAKTLGQCRLGSQRLVEVRLAAHVRYDIGLTGTGNCHALARRVQPTLPFLSKHHTTAPTTVVRQHHVGMLRAARHCRHRQQHHRLHQRNRLHGLTFINTWPPRTPMRPSGVSTAMACGSRRAMSPAIRLSVPRLSVARRRSSSNAGAKR